MSFTQDHWTSVSAFVEARGKDGKGGCMRRWAFRRYFKLPVPSKEATSFGDVFHDVLKRWYLADERGLINGSPLVLYPEGWKKVPDRFGREDDGSKLEISVIEESLIKVLIDKAINDGILVRTPGRLVEQPIPDMVLKTNLSTGAKLILKGYIDLETPSSVEDHKTVKRKKDGSTWAVSLKGLETDAQMLVYAKSKFDRGHTGKLWLVHNNFVKDPESPDVIRREVLVEKGYVEDYFNRILLPGFGEMFKVCSSYSKKDIEKWRSISGPNDPNTECNFYYGGKCPYSSICSDLCDIPKYLEIQKDIAEQNKAFRVESISQAGTEEKTNNRKENTVTNPIDLLRQSNARALGSHPALQNLVPPQSAPQTVAEPAPTTVPTAAATTTPANAVPPARATGNLQAALAAVNAKRQMIQAPVIPAVVETPAAPVVPTVVEIPPAPATPPAPEKQKAPWYQEGCAACSQNEYPGFNSQGNPCLVCDNSSSLKGSTVSTDWLWDVDDSGKISFKPRKPVEKVTPPMAAAQDQATPPAETPKEQAITPKRGKRSQNQVKGTPAQAPAPEQPIPPAPAQEAPLSVGLDEAKEGSFTLLIGTTFIKGHPKELVSADDLLMASMEHVAIMNNKAVDEFISSVDHFAVNKAIETYVPTLAKHLAEARAVVVAFPPTKGSAMAVMLDGLKPYASVVMVGIVG